MKLRQREKQPERYGIKRRSFPSYDLNGNRNLVSEYVGILQDFSKQKKEQVPISKTNFATLRFSILNILKMYNSEMYSPGKACVRIPGKYRD